MTETARVLLTAAVLSAATMTWMAWRIRRADAQDPGRLIGQLRLAQLGALLLASTGAIAVGLALNAAGQDLVHLDAATGIGFIGVAWVVVHRDPREGLFLLIAAFVLHALIDLAHRPGWLSSTITSREVLVGSAVYDVCLAATCYVATRRPR